MHERGLQAVHEMHPFGNVECHLQPLLVGDVGDRFLLLMQDFKESAAVAEFGHDHGLALVCSCAHEQQQVGMADVSQCFDFSLVLNAQLSISD